MASHRTYPQWRGMAQLSLMVAALLSLMAAITSGAAAPVAAAATEWSTTATLGDGVEGLDVGRTTTIEAEVWAIESVGSVQLVGGAFTHVRDRSSFERIPRPFLAAFDPETGEYLPWWQTQPDGPVYDIVDLGDGRALIAGEFSAVNGLAGTAGVAIIDVNTGLVDTSLQVSLGGQDPVVRAVAVHGNLLYLTGGFTTVAAGGISATAGGAARIDLTTGRVDRSWLPRLRGGGGWGIGVATTGRVFIGGYFTSVNNETGTETLAAINPSDGSVVAGWNHGFPSPRCNLGWRATCGAVNGLAVLDDKVFVAGAKHFWSALSVADGTILRTREISNDGQSVDVVNGMIAVGCHCSTSTGSEEFPGIKSRFVRIIDPNTLREVASPTVNSAGAAGGWAAGAAPDGCLWVGGNFSSTGTNGSQNPAWSLLRFCPPNGSGSAPPIPAPLHVDTVAPAMPSQPTIDLVQSANVTISWTGGADDSGQQVYAVYRNGQLVTRTGATSYSDRLLPYDSRYQWRVAAVDLSGNMSSLSDPSTPVAVGPRVNVARLGTADQSSDFNRKSRADKAVDGTIDGDPAAESVSRTGKIPDESRPWWGLDLGRVHHVDRIELHPRNDRSFQESNNRPRIYQHINPITAVTAAEASSGGYRVFTGDVMGPTPKVMYADIANSLRYLRIFLSASRVSFAEVRVWSSVAQPTPPPLVADVKSPTGPTWKRVSVRDGVTELRWGGADDDRGLAYYEVYQNGSLQWTTTDTLAPVGPAGLTATAFSVVAYDAAGNASALVDGPGGPVTTCGAVRDGASVAVTWAGAESASSFIIRRSVDDSEFFWRNRAAEGSASFEDTDRDGVLAYQVQARHGASLSEPVNCDVTIGTGGVPELLEITRAERRKVVLRWQPRNRSVEIARDGVVIATDDDGWYTDAELAPGVQYQYRIRFTGSAEWTEPVIATTLPEAG